MTSAKIINVVSGKGGTGKTLLTAVLADTLGNEGYSVLVVDLDVFVRGLTSLLYFHKKETIQLTKDDRMSVSEFFIDKGDVEISGKTKFSIERYRSFDVIPSVTRVDEILNFKDIMPDSKEQARSIITALISKIHKSYDFIIFDSRAGYDELISATHFLSDISLCVEEEDDISKVTSDNLVKQLKADYDIPVFRITNKARRVKTEDDLSMSGVENLGRVPFDMDVMKSFGKPYFWDDISRTLYKSALARAWNSLSTKIGLEKPIKNYQRVSLLGDERIERKLQFMGLKERVLFIYSMLITCIGIGYGVLGKHGISSLLEGFDPLQSLALVFGFSGLASSLYLVLKNKN